MPTHHTDEYNFPWPDGNELVQDGDNAIKALAEAVDAALKTVAGDSGNVGQIVTDAIKAAMDPPWQALDLSSGVTHLDGYFVPSYRVLIGDKVEFKGGLTRADADWQTFDVLFTLPAGARPSQDAASPIALTRYDMTNETNITTGKVTFKTDGDCTIHIPNTQQFRTVLLDGTFFHRR